MKTYTIDSLFELLNVAGVAWDSFLEGNNLTEDKTEGCLRLAAPERMNYGSNELIGRDGRIKSFLSNDEYDALYRHHELRPDGGTKSRSSAPLLTSPFTAEEFLRFESLLVDELRDVVTLWVEETDKDGKQKLSEVVNQKLIDRLPLDSQELACLLLGKVVEPEGIQSLVGVLQPPEVAALGGMSRTNRGSVMSSSQMRIKYRDRLQEINSWISNATKKSSVDEQGKTLAEAARKPGSKDWCEIKFMEWVLSYRRGNETIRNVVEKILAELKTS